MAGPSRTATLRLQLIDAISGPSKGVANALKTMDGSFKNIGKSAGPEMQRLIAKLEELKRKAASIHGFREAQAGVKEMGAAFRQARGNVAQLEHALKTATGPTGKLKSDLESAKVELRETAAAFRAQANAAKAAKAAMEAAGIPVKNLRSAQELLQKQLDETTNAMNRQARADFEANMSKRPASVDRQRPGDRQGRELLGNVGREAMATAGAYIGPAAAAYESMRQYRNFAAVERRMNRILITGGEGIGKLPKAMRELQRVASDTRMPVDQVMEGLEALVASGRSLDDAFNFLPTVTVAAQASGAAVVDIAKSADAMSASLKIGPEDMAKAFDILVAAGKAGKFELKDMAQYLPEILPRFSALGYKGADALSKVAAMLQTIRQQTGEAGPAATALSNVLQKMYSKETAKKFSDFGIDLTAELDKARAKGEDVIDVFIRLSEKAVKGDLSKLSLIAEDTEFQAGIRAMIQLRGEYEKYRDALENVDGSAMTDFNQVLADSEAKIQRLSTNWSRLMTSLGAGIAIVANPGLEALNDQIDGSSSRIEAQRGMNEEARNKLRNAFMAKYKAARPDDWFWQANSAFMKALERTGRGEIKSPLDDLPAPAAKRPRLPMTAISHANPNFAAERLAYHKQFGQVQFEGGMHRAGLGAGPRAALEADSVAAGAKIKAALSVEASPTLNLSRIMQQATAARARLMAILSPGSAAPAAKTQLGHRANGGHVQAGRSYIVGERGEEVVTMGGNGYVTPNSRLAATSAGNTNVAIHVNGVGDPQQVAERISKILDRQLARSRQTSINGLPVTV